MRRIVSPGPLQALLWTGNLRTHSGGRKWTLGAPPGATDVQHVRGKNPFGSVRAVSAISPKPWVESGRTLGEEQQNQQRALTDVPATAWTTTCAPSVSYGNSPERVRVPSTPPINPISKCIYSAEDRAVTARSLLPGVHEGCREVDGDFDSSRLDEFWAGNHIRGTPIGVRPNRRAEAVVRAFVRLDVAQPPSRDRRDGPRRLGWIATCRLITYPTAGEAPGLGPDTCSA